jgi:hypothetical protein
MPLDVRGYQATRSYAAASGELLAKATSRSAEPSAGDRPASASVTGLRRRGLTTVAKQLTGNSATSSNAATRINGAVDSIRTNQLKAKNAGVDCARKSFASKALGVGLAALGLAVVVSLTVATGGAASIAAAAVAGLAVAVSVADAGCAYMNLKNAEALRDRKPLPFDLPGGSSSIGNLAHRFYKGLGFGDAWAKVLAGWTDGVVRVAMGVAMAVLTMGVTTAAQSFERIAPLVGAGVNLAQAVFDILHNRSTSKIHAASASEVTASFERVRYEIGLIKKEIAKLVAEDELTEDEARAALRDIELLEQDLAQSEKQTGEEVSAMKGAMPGYAAGAANVLPALAGAAMAFVPGLRPEAVVHVTPRGGNMGRIGNGSEPGSGLIDPYARA